MKLALAVALSLVIAACTGAADPADSTLVDTTEPAATTVPPPPDTTVPPEENMEDMQGSVAAAESALGTVLVDENRRSLYIFTVDQGDVSACYDLCEQNWPVVAAGASVDDGVSINTGSTTRNDGAEQLTINGRPVYVFAGDAARGHVNGQGVNGVWFAIGADGEPVDGSVGAADTSLGSVLVDENGRTLYIFNVDQGDVSACYDQCEQNWPSVIAGPVVGQGVDIMIGFTTRNDGAEQLTINGRPIYLFAGDAAPGDVNGQGINGVWFVIGLDGESITE